MELARHTDIDTSHSAGRSIEQTLKPLQKEVLRVFRELGDMTDPTLNDLFSDEGYAESTVRKRRSELTALGLIKDTGRRDGRHAIWQLA